MSREAIQQAVKDERDEARREFIEGCWRDAPAKELLALARTADIETYQADMIRADVIRAQELIPKSADVLTLRAKYNRAREHARKIDRKARALEDKAEQMRIEPSAACDVAQDAMSLAEDAQRALLTMHRNQPDILPEERLPDALRKIKRQDDDERRASQEAMARRDHERRVRDAEYRIARLRAKLRSVPVSAYMAEEERRIKSEIARMEEALEQLRMEEPVKASS